MDKARVRIVFQLFLPLRIQKTQRLLNASKTPYHLSIKGGVVAGGMDTHTVHNGSRMIKITIVATPNDRKRKTLREGIVNQYRCCWS